MGWENMPQKYIESECSSDKLMKKPRWVRTALARIIWDLSDRRGIGNEWERIDEGTKDEIRLVWAKAIEESEKEKF